MSIHAVTQTGEVHRHIRAQKLEMVIEVLTQQLRLRKNATQDRSGGADRQFPVHDEMKGKQGIEKVVR
ncbi:hypothetical protein L107_06713 [Cyanobium sp. Copco_Reservoir_LC18]|nr:hypothetical protein L107_06713 [Cyanobium sp. Copco_Reservoir_LC18]